MRKLIWYVVLSVVAFVGSQSSAGCGSSAPTLCDRACVDYNALRCGAQCDCSACIVAPPACDAYFDCIQTFSGSCVALAVECPIPAQCQPFVSAHCK